MNRLAPRLIRLRTFSRSSAVLALALLLVFMSARAALADKLPQTEIDAINGGSWQYKADNPASCATNVATNGSVDQFIRAIAAHESSGSPTAHNPNPGQTASGKYQYTDQTWRGKAQQYYAPAMQYSAAYLAPEEVQDAVAFIEFTDLWRQFNGDMERMAVAHYYPAYASKDKSTWNFVPAASAGNTETLQEFATKIVDIVKTGEYKTIKIADIPLKYTSAPDFQTWLTKVGGPADGGSTNVASAASTSCGGVPAGQFVFYSQFDQRWANHAYGTSTLAESGCGPSAVAMVVATFVDSSVTPVQTADYGTSIGAFIPGIGSGWGKMLVETPQHWGLNVESLGTDISRAISVLQNGGLVLVGGQGAEPYTTVGHIIVLRSISADGKILIGDSGNPDNNNKEFAPADIAKGAAGMFGVTK